ncbi:YeiH family protein [Formosa sp. A9]|uniref:YeiH family protein n=1 Tax=Formosa sp. A9 TaxID=3442641 RepID=UPI003EBF4A6A
MAALLSYIYFFGVIIAALFGYINSPMALALGFVFSVGFKHPFLKQSQKGLQWLLKLAVVGLGFGMVLQDTIQTSASSFGLILCSVVLTVSFGLFISKSFHLNKHLGHLITSGTSICGGSAIAAISPIIKADSKTISMALVTVFLLNALALFVFPVLGHWLHLNQHDFGLWCAVAIHDTSSVVGAALNYGEEALKIATTVKLSRTLWIIPMSVLSMFAFKTKGQHIKFPYFILLFIGAILINSFHIIPEIVTQQFVNVSKHLLVVSLFLIGTSISLPDLKQAGWKPVVFASILWIFVSLTSLAYILYLQ